MTRVSVSAPSHTDSSPRCTRKRTKLLILSFKWAETRVAVVTTPVIPRTPSFYKQIHSLSHWCSFALKAFNGQNTSWLSLWSRSGTGNAKCSVILASFTAIIHQNVATEQNNCHCFAFVGSRSIINLSESSFTLSVGVFDAAGSKVAHLQLLSKVTNCSLIDTTLTTTGSLPPSGLKSEICPRILRQ